GRFQYTGQMWLPEVGLNNYKERMLAPHSGRFLQPDPIRYGGGPNLYAYVGGDPVNWVDPSGLTRIWACVGVAGGPMSCGWHDTGDGWRSYRPGDSQPAGSVRPDLSGRGEGGGGSQDRNQTSLPIKVTTKDIEDAKKRMIAACAAAPRSAACAAATQAYLSLFGVYMKQNPLPRATGPQQGIDPLRDGVIGGLKASACAFGVAGVARAGLSALLTMEGGVNGFFASFGCLPF
ncbi:MAG: RHS repeat-associated core domain-containing protein, partial [Sphingomicrobium sp.]